MAGTSHRYPTVLFDWGDTVMRDHPEITIPMVEWQTIEGIEGVAGVLVYLRSSGRRLVLATSAAISNEGQIRGALARGGLGIYFSHIFCHQNTNLPKGEEFYCYILNHLGIPASEAPMVGDGFEKDVETPNKLGIFALWFNPNSNDSRKGELHATVHSMKELGEFFKALDQK